MQIDVWQGAVQDFHTDAHSVFTGSDDLVKQLPAALDLAQEKAKAHLKISFIHLDQNLAKLSVELLRDWLQSAVQSYGRDALRLQRVTFVAEEAETYRILQSYVLSLLEDQ